MNKHGRIIEIRGVRGLLLSVFAGCCIVTGFTVFPGFLAMNMWNFAAKYISDLPSMQLIHGVILWIIIFLLWYAFSGKYIGLHLGYAPSDERIQELVEQIKRENEEEDN